VHIVDSRILHVKLFKQLHVLQRWQICKELFFFFKEFFKEFLNVPLCRYVELKKRSPSPVKVDSNNHKVGNIDLNN